AGTRRAAVAAGVPGEHIEAGHPELVGQVRHPPGVLVPPMQQDDRSPRRAAGRPVATVEAFAVAGGKVRLPVFAHPIQLLSGRAAPRARRNPAPTRRHSVDRLRTETRTAAMSMARPSIQPTTRSSPASPTTKAR